MTVSRHSKFAVLASLAVSTSLLTLAPTAANAQETASALKLAPMSLERALDAISRRFEVRIEYDRGLARQARSSPVNASSLQQALQQALAGTSLSETTSPNGTILVGMVSNEDPSEIVVTARRNEAETGYGVQSSSTASRDGKSLREQPQSTTIITARVLEDQQVQSISQALRNASGSTVSGSVQGTPGYTIRGFVAQPTSGGLATPVGNTQPVANIERIEVLKGPAALLSGSGSLGGVVNIVSKRPTTESLLDITAEIASYNEKKLIIDASTALDPAKHFSARLVLQADGATRAPQGYDGRFDNLIAPSIRFKNGVSDFTVGGQGSDTYVPLQRFAYFLTSASVPADVSKVGTFKGLFDRRVGPADSGFRAQEQRVWFDATQKVTPWLTVSSRGIHTGLQLRIKVDGPVSEATNGSAAFQRTDDNQLTVSDAIDNFARLQFGAGAVRNTLVAGYNYSRFRSSQISAAPTANTLFPVTDINTSNLSFEPFPPATTFYNSSISKQNGFYAQDTLDLFGRLHVVAGVRHSTFDTSGIVVRYRRGVPTTTVSTPVRYKATTPSFGAVFDVTSNLSVYGNYIEGFVPSNAMAADGSLLPPTTSTNIEGGAKLDLLHGRLALVASYYRLRQYNVPLFDPVLRYSTLIEGQQSKGFEADVRGQITRGWQIVSTFSAAGYKYLDASQQSRVVLRQPKHRASLFTTYELQGGPLRGLGAGVGVYYNSSSYAGQTTAAAPVPAIVPASTQIDANAFYTIGKVRLNLGVSNLLDRTIYSPSATTSYVLVQPPRMFRLSATYRFFAK